MVDWKVATRRGYPGRDAYVDNPVHLYLTLRPQTSSSDLVGLRRGAFGNPPAWMGSESRSSLPRDTDLAMERSPSPFSIS
jgi:hypothetical protein